jgi:hypothetical protein
VREILLRGSDKQNRRVRSRRTAGCQGVYSKVTG